jgi:hypothetical protein
MRHLQNSGLYRDAETLEQVPSGEAGEVRGHIDISWAIIIGGLSCCTLWLLYILYTWYH